MRSSAARRGGTVQNNDASTGGSPTAQGLGGETGLGTSETALGTDVCRQQPGGATREPAAQGFAGRREGESWSNSTGRRKGESRSTSSGQQGNRANEPNPH
nr:unnamed protein product [Digitaria exilis]